MHQVATRQRRRRRKRSRLPTTSQKVLAVKVLGAAAVVGDVVGVEVGVVETVVVVVDST